MPSTARKVLIFASASTISITIGRGLGLNEIKNDSLSCVDAAHLDATIQTLMGPGTQSSGSG
jgi:hypothetical protein